jgi:hypothetical protein
MIAALESVLEHAEAVQPSRLRPRALAKACVAALVDLQPPFSLSEDVRGALLSIEGALADRLSRVSARDIELDDLLMRILRLARIDMLEPMRELPLSTRDRWVEHLMAVVTSMTDTSDPPSAARHHADEQRIVDALRSALQGDLQVDESDLRVVVSRARRRPPVDIDASRSLVEQIVRTASEELRVRWVSPARRVVYRPDESFADGDIVEHARFGVGEVVRVGGGLVSIRFGDDVVRQLVCDRPARPRT